MLVNGSAGIFDFFSKFLNRASTVHVTNHQNQPLLVQFSNTSRVGSNSTFNRIFVLGKFKVTTFSVGLAYVEDHQLW